ncbi:hypothetical protein HYPBUDRAFT_188020 [Hyphopichia burtonii NRRL Y-1933]|uniref:Uncharacterized protein n=1 Tax=Hyphopichia burtonii NRRL Y-1933 TaxID=984485 RepID=A0A1E4RM90_9ASCO|nr:hypothetical protein HYPBUDRAFT_188020 [Hyphopichia burtonii NRRL Y-1933]ODV68398.1 hypothetical protein HYPBUDRAFT_188020 [Hyphopichia burtonii NRRL Y-1933]
MSLTLGPSDIGSIIQSINLRMVYYHVCLLSHLSTITSVYYHVCLLSRPRPRPRLLSCPCQVSFSYRH